MLCDLCTFSKQVLNNRYDERVKTRGEEQKAITETISFLNNDDALDSFKASSLGLIQKKSFLQRSVRKNNALQKARTVFSSLKKSAKGSLVFLAENADARVRLSP